MSSALLGRAMTDDELRGSLKTACYRTLTDLRNPDSDIVAIAKAMKAVADSVIRDAESVKIEESKQASAADRPT